MAAEVVFSVSPVRPAFRLSKAAVGFKISRPDQYTVKRIGAHFTITQETKVIRK